MTNEKRGRHTNRRIDKKTNRQTKKRIKYVRAIKYDRYVTLNPNSIEGGYLGYVTQNLVKSACVRSITTLL